MSFCTFVPKEWGAFAKAEKPNKGTSMTITCVLAMALEEVRSCNLSQKEDPAATSMPSPLFLILQFLLLQQEE